MWSIQVAMNPVLVGAAFVTIIVASLIPIIRGADLAINGAGPFTQRAEVPCLDPEFWLAYQLKLSILVLCGVMAELESPWWLRLWCA